MGKKITVLGAGAWGSAVALLLAENGNYVKLWCFEQDVVDDISLNKINSKYLPDITLNEQITPTASLQEAIEDSEIIFEAVPILFLRDVISQAREYVKNEQIWVTLSKGIENDTLRFPTQIVSDDLGFDPKIIVLSGPNFANQVAQREISGAVVASKDIKLADMIKSICENSYFKISTSSDLIGVQVCGALKNVISIFLGILDGSGYKENTRAYFLTRGLEEMRSIVKFFEGDIQTVCSLSGVGDLILGLMGKRNRNYEAGVMIGQGNSISDLSQTIDVLPEGINSVKSVQQIIKKHSLKLPICSSTYEILYRKSTSQFFYCLKTSLGRLV